MEPLTVLRREHTRIAQLFVEFESLPERACTGRKAIMRELDALVRRHMEMEEALIYPPGLHEPHEHRLISLLLDDIARTDCRDDAYLRRERALRDVLMRHMKEEEARVFPGYAEVA